MISKKQLLAEIESLKNQIQNQQEDMSWYNQENIQLKSLVTAAKAQANIFGNSGVLTDISTSSEYNQILNNEIPSNMSWIYWKWINQLTNYWLGKYNEFETDKYDKQQIIATMWVAIMYGIAGYDKESNQAYFISSQTKNGDYVCYLANEVIGLRNNAFKRSSESGNVTWKFNTENKKSRIIKKENIAICSWRFGNIGNFVWYMQDGLMYLYTKQIVCCNASNLTNALWMKVNDLDNLPTEQAKNWTSPFSNIKYIQNSFGSEKLGEGAFNSKIDLIGASTASLVKKDNSQSFTDDLIMTTKFIQEQFCNQYGIPITSAKEQSLSADANLSVCFSENIAKEHDRRIKEFLKELDIEIEIESMIKEPQNENADKNGEGFSNTNGEKVEGKE